MKKRNWLNVTEYLLLVGSGVGSIASAASQQILFTAAPMSALLLLNVLNRRHLADQTQRNLEDAVSHLDQKLTNDIAAVQQQIQALPNFLDLSSLRKTVLSKNKEAINELAASLAQLQQELAKPEWRWVQDEVLQLQGQYADLTQSITAITDSLHRLTEAGKRNHEVEQETAELKSELSQLRSRLEQIGDEQKLNHYRVLQDQINHLNRRFNKLPTPFDPSALKQDIDALIKVVGDLVSRRDLAKIETRVQQLAQQHETIEYSVTPLKIATTILRKQMDTMAHRLSDELEAAGTRPQGTAETGVIEELKVTMADLEQRLAGLPTTTDLEQLRTEFGGTVASQLQQLQQQLSTVQQLTQTLEQQHKTLYDWVNRLPQLLDSSALQNEVKYLATRVEWTENTVTHWQTHVDDVIKTRLDEAVQQLQAAAPPYEFVFDIQPASNETADTGCSSRRMLEQALTEAQSRLIVVYPYPDAQTLDDAMLTQFRAFLERKGCLDIGWGHLGDVSNRHQPRSIDRRRTITATDKDFLYHILSELTQLKRQYPEQFRFKVLGTDESFLVCDRTYAILGSQSVPTASVVFPQAAVGLRTTEQTVIRGLMTRFDDPALEDDDSTAYFYRAATRYDLGDLQGAIADYNEVIRITPNDDVTYNNRGLARYDLGDKPGAVADFEQAVHHNPENYIAYCNRGFVRSDLGDKLGAIEDYTYAIQLNPDYTTAYFYRGLARTRLQNKIGAVRDYTEVIRLNPQDASAYFYRGLACIKLGHRLEAIKDLRQAAHLFAEQGDTASYQQTLQAIKKLHKTLVIAGSKPMVSNGA